MRRLSIVLVLFGLASIHVLAQCGTPKVSHTTQPAKEIAQRQASDPSYVGTVELVAVVTEEGLVCGIAVAQGVSKELDKRAVQAVKDWKFEPALKDRKPVVVMVKIAIDLHHDAKTGEFTLKTVSGPARKSS